MKRQNKARSRCVVNAGRWVSYAAAGAATAVAASAEGGILYSGVLNETAAAPGTTYLHLKSLIANSHPGTVNFGSVTHKYVQFPPGPGGGGPQANFYATFGMYGSLGHGIHGRIRGTNAGGNNYASKLAMGANISAGPFGGSAGHYVFGKMASFQGTVAGGHPPGPGSVVGNRKWATDGTGFLGFSFNTGAGLQYGWARVTMSGGFKHTTTLVDYAYGTPGQSITAGQTAVPEPKSLGMLAVGAVGLLAVRAGKKRRISAA